MWTIFERIMAVIGFIATVGGTLIAYYAFVQPADLSTDLSRIADRLGQEPVLAQDERIYVGQVLDMGPNMMVYIEKQATNETGTFELTICNASTGASAGKFKIAFGKEASNYTPQFPAVGPNLNLLLRVSVGRDAFTRKELWQRTNGNWARADLSVVAGSVTLTCVGL